MFMHKHVNKDESHPLFGDRPLWGSDPMPLSLPAGTQLNAFLLIKSSQMSFDWEVVSHWTRFSPVTIPKVRKPLYLAGGDVKWHSRFGKQFHNFLKS